MLLGTINHSLFDAAIKNQQFDSDFLKKQLESIVEQGEIVESLSCMNIGKDEMVQKLIPSVYLISKWGNKFCKRGGDTISYGQKGDEATKVDQVLLFYLFDHFLYVMLIK